MSGIHDRLDWNLLRTFIAIVQEGSISRAADRLHLTQPAISLALKRLEERLDERLIIRNGTTFELSKAGELVYREAIVIYGSIARLTTTVRATPHDLSGIVRIALVTGINSDVFDHVLAEFHKNNPRVTFEILSGSSEYVKQNLLNYNASVGICLKYRKHAELSDTLLLSQKYNLYCGKDHHLYQQENINIRTLRDEFFVSFASEQLDGVLAPLAIYRAQERLEGRIVGTSDNLEEVKRMIKAGLGIGALPENVVQQDVLSGTLWQLPPYDGLARISLYLMWNRTPKFSEAEEVFFSALMAALQNK
ncbi:LysR family transcriptional regulator [Marinomonas pollencensis]|uniref:LysR family transcriptional regulator n=1 Tax=Marinomonas pollencensis TaxID=491954 RepID=A0A3E0DKG7_9GAMM|nr:LysR family transcriptional regulator [Marinomonas pollencensis]REG83187.1 LysR family transcriptional regulator [Marinomonas pollencensis]